MHFPCAPHLLKVMPSLATEPDTIVAAAWLLKMSARISTVLPQPCMTHTC